ncbi:hypothetical protein KA107_02275 [Candidatus Pacearchaeota archaeon]|nr:hypothetical protein [Candidatus Pacearchaeota archaeon]
MNLDILRKVGLSEGEVKVYRAVLEIGATTINNVHERVGMDRRNIYDILNKLIERGLISYFDENGKRTFRISNPDKLISYIEEKKSNLEDIRKEIMEILPQVKEVFNSKKEETFSEIFKGPEGMKAVWDDMLNYPEIRWIASGMYVPERFPAFFKDWNKRRIALKVKSYHLFRHEKRGEIPNHLCTVFKFLPKEFSGNAAVTVIYGDKVIQQLLGEEIQVFVIQSKELAENYKQYHRYLWDKVAKE